MNNEKHDEKFYLCEKNGVKYEVPYGCPDYGPPGDRHCYECYEPVDDKTLNSYLDYNDPMAAVLGKCDICGAPDYQHIGRCPSCNGPVYNFGDNYTCYNTISGACDFSISKEYLEEQEIYLNVELGNLLVGTMCNHEIHGPGEPHTITYQKIVHSTSTGWIIETTDYDPDQITSDNC